jgi:hypothetical protein
MLIISPMVINKIPVTEQNRIFFAQNRSHLRIAAFFASVTVDPGSTIGFITAPRPHDQRVGNQERLRPQP